MQTAAGLSVAHTSGLIHRDLKPDNLLMDRATQKIKLTDFGLARPAQSNRLTQSGGIVGTPFYMSPEQVYGDDLDPRSDLFSLGTILYAMCTGQLPFDGDTSAAIVRNVAHATPTPIRSLNTSIPAWLEEIIQTLHAKNPADRFASAESLRTHLVRRLASLYTARG
jgi:serine/threonine protein kinase